MDLNHRFLAHEASELTRLFYSGIYNYSLASSNPIGLVTFLLALSPNNN
jgi:hypothetical protein